MNKVLISGGDSYLGLLMARKYLEFTDKSLILWCRASDDEILRKKTEKLNNELGDYRSRVVLAFGELEDEQPFWGVDANSVEEILHIAAVTRFNVEEDIADTVNSGGSRKLFEFARSCKHLKKLGHVSTVYSCGLQEGTISEHPPAPVAGFANHYERSKCESEQILMQEYDDLPWNIYRLATIVCHDNNGLVLQFNALHNTIRILFHGLISIMPGYENTPLYFVTGEYCRDAMFYFMQNFSGRKIYNICYEKEDNLSLRQFIDYMFQGFHQDEAFIRRRVMKPLFTELDVFEGMADMMSRGLGGELVRSALNTIRPYAKQMFSNKDIDNSCVRESFPDYKPPEMDKLFVKTVNYLTESQWGRRNLN